MSDDQNQTQPSGREPALSEESVPRTGNEPALSFDHLLPGLRDGLTAEDREARLRALQAAFDKPEKSIHLLRVLLDAEYDPRTRQRAAAALGQIGDVQSVPALIKIIGDPNPKVRRVAIWALGQIGSEDAYSSLIDQLEIETEPGIQYLLVEALDGCTDMRLVPLLLQFRAAYEEGHKSYLLSSDLLGHIAFGGDYDQLTTLLEHNNQEAQHWAAEVVAARCPPTVDNIPLLLQCAALEAAVPAFQVIARIDDDSKWEVISQYLHSDRRVICQAVLRALGSIGNERSETMIIEFLRANKREELAKEAIDILQSNGGLAQRSFSSELVTILIDLYKTADNLFRFSLIDYLGQINDERAYSHLREVCLKADLLPMRHRALLNLCVRNTLTPFMVLELLNDNECVIRHHAAWCLHSIILARAITPHDHQVLIEGVRSHLSEESEADIRLFYILILLDAARTNQLLEMAYQELKQLDSPTSGVRGIVGHLMSEGSPFQTRTLELVRSHPVAEIRRSLIQELSYQDDIGSINTIIERLHSDSDEGIRHYCAGALQHYPPSPAIISALIEALNDDVGRNPVCETAALVLHNIGTPEALTALEAWERGRS